MIKNVENKMEKVKESNNKELEGLKDNHTGKNSTITEIKNILERINNRISETEPDRNSRKLKNTVTEMKNSMSGFVNRLNTNREVVNWKVGQNKLSRM